MPAKLTIPRPEISVLAVVDTGPLVAAADVRDAYHRSAIAVLSRSDLSLVIPTMVVAEVSYLVAAKLGPLPEARFLASMMDFEVEAPQREDWVRIAELVRQYRNFPLGGTDASVIALAERLGTDLIITVDRRHFAAVRPRHVPCFRLLPD